MPLSPGLEYPGTVLFYSFVPPSSVGLEIIYFGSSALEYKIGRDFPRTRGVRLSYDRLAELFEHTVDLLLQFCINFCSGRWQALVPVPGIFRVTEIADVLTSYLMRAQVKNE